MNQKLKQQNNPTLEVNEHAEKEKVDQYPLKLKLRGNHNKTNYKDISLDKNKSYKI